MNTALVGACVALAGCYAAGRPGVSAPVGHGHGGAGFDLGLALGTEYSDEQLRAGGGVDFGPRLADNNGYIPFGFEGHIAVAVGGQPYGDQLRPMVVAHVVLGFGSGLPQSGDTGRPDSPSGYFAQAFAGVGLGSPTTQHSYNIRAGHVALGLTATRFWPDGGDSFWMVGVAGELSFGWFQRRSGSRGQTGSRAGRRAAASRPTRCCRLSRSIELGSLQRIIRGDRQ